MNLRFALPRHVPPEPSAPATLPPDGYARVEAEVARTADLVLKVHRLLERVECLDTEPGREARVARLTWVLERGQEALHRVATADPGPVPGPRQQP